MNQRLRYYYLQQMGIEVWEKRPRTTAHHLALKQLEATVAGCTRCPLHQTRTQTVFARGNTQASLMIIGEAPGFYEDKQGEPFVGKAGQLLNHMLQSVALKDVYIANVIKCRPPDNRDPKQEEILACSDYLKEQIALVKPKLILAVGRFAGQFLLNKTLALAHMRGVMHHYQQIPVVVSYHPAYLLRNTRDKKKAFVDLTWVKRLLDEN